MKKLLSTLTAILIFFATSHFAWATFPDVPFEHPNYQAISYVQSNNIVSGHPDGNYKPDDPIDRAAFTKIVVEARYTEWDIENCGSSDLIDIPEGVWYDRYVCVAQKQSILSGYPDGTFQAANPINVVEASKIIANAFGYETQEDPIWYKPYVLSLEEQSALPTTFTGFDQKVTRGEMAEMIYRITTNVADKPSTTYSNLEQGIKVNEETPSEPSDNTMDLNQIRECSYVKTVDFTVDEEKLIHYGSFAWTGTVVSTEEDGETHLWLKVPDDDSLAMEFYKKRAPQMSNQGLVRYLEDHLHFQLGSLMEGDLFTYAEDIDEATKTMILEKIDSDEEITLNFAVKFIEGGSAGLFGATFACSVGD